MRTSDGEELPAELVIDCSGRRSALPTWLEALGARPPVEEVEDSGFIYLARHFRSRDGELPFALGPLLQSYGSISVLTLPADNATWSVTLVARSGDRALLGLKDVTRWESVLRSLPTVAHWIAGDPIEDRIITMAKIEDRYRDLRPDGVPVATGVLAVADAWACTNPSVGRGRVDRHAPRADGARHIAPHRAGSTGRALRGLRRGNGRHRRALVPSDPHLRPSPAGRNGRSGQGGALRTRRPRLRNERRRSTLARGRDPDVLRGFLDIVGVLELPAAVMARPGMVEKVTEYGADWRTQEPIGPDRTELVALATA